MTKQISSQSLVADNGADLAPLIGKTMDDFTVAWEHIVEDSVLLNPKKTMKELQSRGLDIMTASEILVCLQNKFPRHNTETNEIEEGNGAEFTLPELIAIQIMLAESRFFKDQLHRQPTNCISTAEYLRTAGEIESAFKVDIPK